MKVNFNKAFIDADGKEVFMGDQKQMISERLGFLLFNLAQIKGNTRLTACSGRSSRTRTRWT